jgi:hypothetical protein
MQACIISLLITVAAQAAGTPQGVPTLNEMAGDWMAFANVANPPAVHNFHEMLLVDRSLTSVFFYPQDWLWHAGQFKRGFPPVTLTLDGREYPAAECRWFAYRALRRNLNCDGLAVESDTRMVNERRAVLVRVRVSNPSKEAREITLALTTAGTNGVNTTQRKGVTTVTRPVQKPDSVVNSEGNVRWEWKAKLAPGGEQVLEFAQSDDGWTGDFAEAFDGFKNVWEQRWADAFTPGNKHFSGWLPVLQTENRELARNYYMGALTLIALERTNFPPHPRMFTTNGERAPGTYYFWDASLHPVTWALLEPAGMKATLRRILVQNVRGSPVMDLRTTKGFDTRAHKQITGYAFNACTIFRLGYDYLRATGDLAFLDEKLENGQTVLERLDAIANDWKTLVLPGSALANYGGNANLLECAPAYVHRVPSANAQNVLMMREVAALYDLKGNAERARQLRGDADKLVPAVLALYKPGDGVWYGLHNDGQRVELRHCVDYIYVGRALMNDLTPTMRSEMTGFVKRELLTSHWMRAMSLQDAAAARSDRPDHGPLGAYDGWIPLTVRVMWQMGFPRDAFEFYCRTAVVTKEAPFTQAHEFYGPERRNFDAPVRVAERQGCMKESPGGIAFTEVVLDTFFGFKPAFDEKAMLVDAETPRPFTGKLRHVRRAGKLVTISASSMGSRLEAE